MTGGNIFKLMFIASLLFSVMFLGCGSGGGGDDLSGGVASIDFAVSPSEYNFGTVTPGNSPVPLYVVIKNTGKEPLKVSKISLGDTKHFDLNVKGGSNPCKSSSPRLAVGDRCTVRVQFRPKSVGAFRTKLRITAEDAKTLKSNLPLKGRLEEISTLNVRINQVESACPSNVVTAYVSVTDQGGYPVPGLSKDDFLITETGGYSGPPTSASFVKNSIDLSVAAAMDYSRSVRLDPDVIIDMEESAVGFVNQMGILHEAAIIKFCGIIEVFQKFTSDASDLRTAIKTYWDESSGTALYDAGKKAVDITEQRSMERKAVVLMSDGLDNSSNFSANDLISHALSKNIPLFTIGLGDSVDEVVLKKLADQTGGHYYTAENSDNLLNVYQQLADILFSYQYILTYTTGLANGTTDDLTVGATLPLTTITGSNTRSITSCP